MKKIFYLALTISLISLSCSVEKRVYNSGYHVTWKNNQQASESDAHETMVGKTKETTENVALVPSSSISEDDQVNSSVSESSEEVLGNVYQPSMISKKKFLNPITETKKFQANEKPITSFKNRVFKQGNRIPLEKSKQGDVPFIALLILCFFLPPIAVGLRTNWQKKKTLISLILTICFWIPGIIYALYVVLN